MHPSPSWLQDDVQLSHTQTHTHRHLHSHTDTHTQQPSWIIGRHFCSGDRCVLNSQHHHASHIDFSSMQPECNWLWKTDRGTHGEDVSACSDICDSICDLLWYSVICVSSVLYKTCVTLKQTIITTEREYTGSTYGLHVLSLAILQKENGLLGDNNGLQHWRHPDKWVKRTFPLTHLNRCYHSALQIIHTLGNHMLMHGPHVFPRHKATGLICVIPRHFFLVWWKSHMREYYMWK